MFLAHGSLLQGHSYVGIGTDPPQFMWFLTWWPYAITHGLDPLFSPYVWAPAGSDIAAATSVPTLAFMMWPVTAVVGPVEAYNVLAIASPIVAATGCFLVCWLLTKSPWASIVSGWLFAFSAYEFGHLINDAHMFFVGWIPFLVALFILRFRHQVRAGSFFVATALLLLLQFGTSLEVLATFTFLLGCTGVLAYLFCSSDRRQLISLGVLIGLAYVMVTVITLPFEVALLQGMHQLHPPTTAYVADLANYLVPTPITALGGQWATSLSRHFTGNVAENAAYLGLPAMAICLWWAATHWSSGWVRVVFGVWLIAIGLSLGPNIRVLGSAVTAGPWALVERLPLLSYALPVRLALYTSLATALMVGMWLTEVGRRGSWRTALAVSGACVAVVSVWPSAGPVPGLWETPLTVPAVFTQQVYAKVIPEGATVVVLPYGVTGDSMLWQAEDKMRFRMAGGYVAGFTPLPFLRYSVVEMFYQNHPAPGFQGALVRFVRAHKVDEIVIAASDMGPWAAAMKRLQWGYKRLGGAYVFMVPRGLR